MSARVVHRCALILGVAIAGLPTAPAAAARAQRLRAPEAGGRTHSLGQPLRWRWQAALGAGAYLDGSATDVMVRVAAGAYHSPVNPVTKLAELGMEGYVGARGGRADAGVRALLQVPYLSAGLGADYNLNRSHLDMLVALHTPVRRGGLLMRGSRLRVDWYPLLGQSFILGLSAPLGDPLAGRNRPLQDHVVVARDEFSPTPHRSTDPTLLAALDSLRVSAEWIRRLVVPFLDQDGRDATIAVARTARYLGELRQQLATRSVDAEVRFFHGQLEHVFAVASGSAAAGRELARRGREILLEEVLLPYDRLLGRKKRHDTLRELNVAARGRFGRWVASSALVRADRVERVLFGFERLTDIVEAIRRKSAKEWDDPRLVWLPLQYALRPEDHDEQAELEALVERATEAAFTDHNRIAYLANLQFHWELLRMIHETRDYHVLWIHDFPAVSSERGLDWAAFAQVVDGYLAALTARVEAYDSVGALPSFFIFLDQHYYEHRKSRLLMNVLEDPLRASPNLPLGGPQDAERLAGALDRLRRAVANSRVLQSEAREYGGAWLRNRIKVHVNITNRVDPSFWSGGLVSTVFGYPDDVMRDHRKIAFRDVSERDPFEGVAILTGMGVGQHYLGPGWDDRSLAMQGPALLDLKRAARELLLTQGLTEEALPPPLRIQSPGPDTHARLVARPDVARFDARALAVVNGTGFLPKPLNVAKAVLYSLLPPGSVAKVPDSLWNSSFFAGLLVGACLRGGHVLVIAPAQRNAPSSGFPQMARAHELLTRLLLVRRELDAAITGAGGDLRTGLYALPPDQHGFASRADLWARQLRTETFLRALLPFAPALVPLVADVGSRAVGSASDAAATEAPKLHQKVQFLATREFWQGITESAEWPRFMATYLRYREATYSPAGAYAEARWLSDSLELIAEQLVAPVRAASRAASFAIVGSQNQDYRGMFMDGEVAVLFTGAESLVPLIDLVFLVGTVSWVDDQATLDRLVPPVGELKRRIGRVTKDGV